MKEPSAPYRPPAKRTGHYAALDIAKQQITQPQKQKELFSMIITATAEEGATTPEPQLLIDLVFKPIEPGLKLRRAETQLLLAYMGEILKELEEQDLVIADGRAAER